MEVRETEKYPRVSSETEATFTTQMMKREEKNRRRDRQTTLIESAHSPYTRVAKH
jgi:hypothetical protein